MGDLWGNAHHLSVLLPLVRLPGAPTVRALYSYSDICAPARPPTQGFPCCVPCSTGDPSCSPSPSPSHVPSHHPTSSIVDNPIQLGSIPVADLEICAGLTVHSFDTTIILISSGSSVTCLILTYALLLCICSRSVLRYASSCFFIRAPYNGPSAKASRTDSPEITTHASFRD